jgi:hypothetical protein
MLLRMIEIEEKESPAKSVNNDRKGMIEIEEKESAAKHVLY